MYPACYGIMSHRKRGKGLREKRERKTKMDEKKENKVMLMIRWRKRHELVTCDLNDEQTLDAIEVGRTDSGSYWARLGGNPLGKRVVLMAFEVKPEDEDDVIVPQYPLTLEITIREFHDRVMRERTARGWVD